MADKILVYRFYEDSLWWGCTHGIVEPAREPNHSEDVYTEEDVVLCGPCGTLYEEMEAEIVKMPGHPEPKGLPVSESPLFKDAMKK